MRNSYLLSLIWLPLLAFGPSVWAQSGDNNKRFTLGLETGGVGFSRNDIRIPNETGTRFDMTDLTGSGPDFFFRLNGTWNINPKHSVRVVVAPLEVSGTGTLTQDTDFAGEQFAAGATRGTYQFNAYKVSYRYTFVDKPNLQWRVGFTGLVRDANVDLTQGNLQANDDNVGFVPALHLSSDYRFADRWTLRFDFDGLAGGPGRLVDAAIKVDYDVNDRWSVGGGYRTFEGGADTDEVYSFGWLHFGTLDIRYRF